MSLFVITFIMNEKDQKILFDLVKKLIESTQDLVDAINHLPNDLQKIITTPPPSLHPTREYILRTLFPHLFSDEVLKYDRDHPSPDPTLPTKRKWESGVKG